MTLRRTLLCGLALLGMDCNRFRAGVDNDPDIIGRSPHVVTIPATSGRADKIVFLLHGIGGRGEAMREIGTALGALIPETEVIAPDGFYPHRPRDREWFAFKTVYDPDLVGSLSKIGPQVLAFMMKELDTRGLAHDRYAVMGTSQGAAVATWMAIHASPPPLAVAVLAGLAPEEPAPPSPTVSTPVFIGHGQLDEIVSVKYVDPTARVLQSFGAKVEMHLYPTLAHEWAPRELEEMRAFFVRTLSHR